MLLKLSDVLAQNIEINIEHLCGRLKEQESCDLHILEQFDGETCKDDIEPFI